LPRPDATAKRAKGEPGPGCTVETTMRSMRTRTKELSLGTNLICHRPRDRSLLARRRAPGCVRVHDERQHKGEDDENPHLRRV